MDWVKVESFDDVQPPTGISHENITLSVGDEYYVSPTITPSNVINYAYSMTTDDTDVVEIYNYLEEYHAVYHKLIAIGAGTAVIRLTTADGKNSCTFTVTVT